MRENVNIDDFIVDKNKELQSTSTIDLPEKITGYDESYNVVDINDKKCLCIIDLPNNKFWIKINKREGRPFNPLSYSSVQEYLPEMGSFAWRFHEVSKECAMNYLRFLQTKNSIYLHNAHRQITYN